MPKEFISQRTHDYLFYRTYYRRGIILAIIFLFADLALIILIYYNSLHIKKPPNFATTSDGRVIQVLAEK